MAKSVSKPKTGFYVVIGILLVLVAVFAVLYAQTLSSYAQTQGSYSSVKYNYSVLQSNYNTLKYNYITEKVNFSSLQAAYNNLSKKYNITEYNLTHPYIKILANKQDLLGILKNASCCGSSTASISSSSFTVSSIWSANFVDLESSLFFAI